MNISVRADSSIYIGTGHIMRCLALSDALRSRGAKVDFITREEPGNLIETIKDYGFEVHALPGNIAVEEDAYLAYAYLKSLPYSTDHLIVDHYGLDIKWESPFRYIVKNIIVLDEPANRSHDCDILLDQQYITRKNRYQNLVPDNCVQLLGPEYAILRPEFFRARKNLQEKDGKVNRLLIFMGGVDSKNITTIVLKAIGKLNRSDIKTEVVLGEKNPSRNEIIKLAERTFNTTVHVNVKNMADLMSHCDLVIGAGGTNTWERCCLGLPSVVIATAANQIEVVNELSKEGYVVYAGFYENITEQSLLENICPLLENPDRVKELSIMVKELVDGAGADRVADKIFELNYLN